MHHIMYDAWSLEILQRELSEFYALANRGLDPLSKVDPLPNSVSRFYDMAKAGRPDSPARSTSRVLESATRWKPTGHPAL